MPKYAVSINAREISSSLYLHPGQYNSNPKNKVLLIGFTTFVKEKYTPYHSRGSVDGPKFKVGYPKQENGGIYLSLRNNSSREMIEEIIKTLSYSYLVGGCTVNLSDSQTAVIKSSDKKRSTVIRFEKEDDSYIIPIKKFRLRTEQIQMLLSFFNTGNLYYADYSRPEF